jgi:hypothetical protein
LLVLADPPNICSDTSTQLARMYPASLRCIVDTTEPLVKFIYNRHQHFVRRRYASSIADTIH